MRVPANPLSRAADVAAQGPDLARRMTALLPRAVGLLDSAERIITRVEALLDRLEGCEVRVEAVIGQVASTERAARRVVDETAALEDRAQRLFDGYEPVVDGWLRTAAHASERIGPDQVDAMVAYLEFLPMLQTIDRDVVPMMSTLQSVAPDLTELLAVSRGLNELMGSVPGLGRAKRRVDEQLANDGDDADTGS